MESLFIKKTVKFEEKEEKIETCDYLGGMQDKGSVSLTESPTFWQISIAGTCVALSKTEVVQLT